MPPRPHFCLRASGQANANQTYDVSYSMPVFLHVSSVTSRAAWGVVTNYSEGACASPQLAQQELQELIIDEETVMEFTACDYEDIPVSHRISPRRFTVRVASDTHADEPQGTSAGQPNGTLPDGRGHPVESKIPANPHLPYLHAHHQTTQPFACHHHPHLGPHRAPPPPHHHRPRSALWSIPRRGCPACRIRPVRLLHHRAPPPQHRGGPLGSARCPKASTIHVRTPARFEPMPCNPFEQAAIL